MADVLGEIIVEVKAKQDKLEADLKRIDGKLKGEGEKLGNTLGSSMGSSLSKAFIAVGGVVLLSKITSFVKESVTAYSEQENALKKLEVAYGKNTKSLAAYASELQRNTIYGDETIIEAEALIAAFVKEEGGVKKLTKATLDFATAKGMDLKSAADLLTKTVASETNALGRYGIQVEGAAGSTERLNSAVNAINKAFGGQAEGQLNTYAGKLQNLNNAWGDFKETIGQAVIPVLEDLMRGLKATAEWLGIFEKSYKSISTASVIQELKDAGASTEDIRKLQQQYLEELRQEIIIRSGVTSGIINNEKIQKLIFANQEAINESLKEELRLKTLIVQTMDEDKKEALGKQLEIIQRQTLGYRQQASDYAYVLDLLREGKNVQNEINGIVTKTNIANGKSKIYNNFTPFGYETQNFTSKLNDTTTPKTIKNSAWEQMIWGLKAQEGLMVEQKNLWTDLQSASSQAMGNLISQWAGAINVIKNANSMLQQFVNTLAQVALQQLESYAIGSFSGGGILGGIASLFSGSSSAGSVAKNAASVTNSKTNIMSWKVDNQSLLLSTQNASKIKESYF